MWRKITLLVLLLISSLAIVNASSSISSDSNGINEWMMFGRTLDGARSYPHYMNTSNLTLVDKINVGSNITTSPIGLDGIIYFNALNRLYAYNYTLKSFVFNVSINTTRANRLAMTSNILIVTYNDTISAYNLSGSTLWDRFIGNLSNTTLAINNGLIYTSTDNETLALNLTNGTTYWNQTSPAGTPQDLLIQDNKIIQSFDSIDGVVNGRIAALNITNGSIIWDVSAQGAGRKAYMLISSESTNATQLWWGERNDGFMYVHNLTNGTLANQINMNGATNSYFSYNNNTIFNSRNSAQRLYLFFENTGTMILNGEGNLQAHTGIIISDRKTGYLLNNLPANLNTFYYNYTTNDASVNTTPLDNVNNEVHDLQSTLEPIIINNHLFISGNGTQQIYVFSDGLNLSISSISVIIDNYTAVTQPKYCQATINWNGNPDEAVYFNVTNPAGSLLLNRLNGTKLNSNTWNSTSFIINQTGAWNCIAEATSKGKSLPSANATTTASWGQPSILTNFTNPTAPRFANAAQCNNNISAATNDIITFANYTITAPDGGIRLNNINGTNLFNLWNSSSITINQTGAWRCLVSTAGLGNATPTNLTWTFNITDVVTIVPISFTQAINNSQTIQTNITVSHDSNERYNFTLSENFDNNFTISFNNNPLFTTGAANFSTITITANETAPNGTYTGNITLTRGFDNANYTIPFTLNVVNNPGIIQFVNPSNWQTSTTAGTTITNSFTVNYTSGSTLSSCTPRLSSINFGTFTPSLFNMTAIGVTQQINVSLTPSSSGTFTSTLSVNCTTVNVQTETSNNPLVEITVSAAPMPATGGGGQVIIQETKIIGGNFTIKPKVINTIGIAKGLFTQKKVIVVPLGNILESSRLIKTCTIQKPYFCDIIEGGARARILLEVTNDKDFFQSYTSSLVLISEADEVFSTSAHMSIINPAAYFETTSCLGLDNFNLYCKSADGKPIGIRYWWIVAITFIMGGGLLYAFLPKK